MDQHTATSNPRQWVAAGRTALAEQMKQRGHILEPVNERQSVFRIKNLRLSRTALLAILTITAIAATACSGSRGGGGDFDIRTYRSGGVLDGRETTLQAVLDQGKPVVLNFWAGRCPPCEAEMPTLNDAWEDNRDDVVVLGVDIGPFFAGLGNFNDGVALINRLEIVYPTGSSSSASLLRDFNLTGLPATFFMLPDGTINDTWPGAITSGQLHRRIGDLVEAHEANSG